MSKIDTVLADNQFIFLKGLKSVLTTIDKKVINIKAEFQDGNQLISFINSTRPQLLILDFNLKTKNGLDVIKFIKRNKIKTKIVILSAYDDTRLVKTALKLGVNGYILKSVNELELKHALNQVMQDNIYVSDKLLIKPAFTSQNTLSNKFFFQDDFLKKFSLTKREQEIMGLITNALSSKEIARHLFISDQTVSVHRKNIMRKLGVNNTAALIKVAYGHKRGS